MATQKTFRINPQIGTSKYSITFHDGVSTHRDGSPFHDLHISKNKSALRVFADKLRNDGYLEN